MKKPTSHLAWITLALAGCVGQPDEATTIASALEEENGGLDMDDEAPVFDDAAAFDEAAVEGTDVYADDFGESDATVAQMIELPNATVARVALLWGQLPADLENDEVVVDWSGSIAVNRGALVVRRTVGFEEATDRVLPRTDRARVDFESLTRPFADGLVLTVVDPDPAAADPLTLTYTRNDGTVHTLELRSLLEGPVVRVVDDQGDRIVAHALRRDRDPCDHGFGRGRWRAIRDHLGGMMGIITDDDGTPIGHIRGIWGVRRNGEHVFFGKYIGADGRFRGIFGGHWRDGEMIGRWMTRAGEFGRLQGRYEESLPGVRRGGHFALRWAEASCAQDIPSE